MGRPFTRELQVPEVFDRGRQRSDTTQITRLRTSKETDFLWLVRRERGGEEEEGEYTGELQGESSSLARLTLVSSCMVC